jgi:hypothetical protein
MRRVAFVMLCSCVLAFGLLGGPAKAGGYETNYVWYSSSCCYQKVVRHQRSVRYVPTGGYAPNYVRYVRPRFYGLPTGRYRHVQFSEFNYSGVIAYAGHDCYWRKVPLGDGWAWGLTKICY